MGVHAGIAVRVGVGMETGVGVGLGTGVGVSASAGSAMAVAATAARTVAWLSGVAVGGAVWHAASSSASSGATSGTIPVHTGWAPGALSARCGGMGAVPTLSALRAQTLLEAIITTNW